jgi:hypothetical protein
MSLIVVLSAHRTVDDTPQSEISKCWGKKSPIQMYDEHMKKI